MEKPLRAEWRLPPSEVNESWSGASSGRPLARSSRSLASTGRSVTFRHVPTGIELTGQIPLGSYAKKEMQRLTQDLRVQLWKELEDLVAARLRIRGR